MEEHESRWTACGRKRMYFSRRAAHRAAVFARKVSGHANIAEYRCPFYTDHFHIGHSNPPEGPPPEVPAWKQMWLDAAKGVQR